MFSPDDIDQYVRELYDPLTGIPGPGLFLDRVQQGMHVAQREELSMGLLLVDIDYGAGGPPPIEHRKELLQQVAGRLVDELRVSDSVGRLDVDRFGILLPHAYAEGMPGLVSRITLQLEAPYQLEGAAVTIRARIGSTIRLDGESDSFSLIHRTQADLEGRWTAERQALEDAAKAAPAAQVEPDPPAPQAEPAQAAPAAAPLPTWPTEPAIETVAAVPPPPPASAGSTGAPAPPPPAHPPASAPIAGSAPPAPAAPSGPPPPVPGSPAASGAPAPLATEDPGDATAAA